MKIIIVSNTCSDEMYEKLQNIKYSEIISPQQNYFSMLIDGLAENSGTEVVCVSARSIAEDNTNVKVLPSYYERITDNKVFYYTTVRASNISRNITNYWQTKKLLKKLIREWNNEDCIAIVDPLSFDTTMGAVSVLKNVKKIALVTDIPIFITAIGKRKTNMIGVIKSKIKNSIFMRNINRFDGYCFLTPSMNSINSLDKPFCVIEGMVPVEQKAMCARTGATSKRIVLYAGGLYEKFGIKNLVEAAKQINDDRFELHLYGEGNCVDYINDVHITYPYIQYKGVLGSEEIKCAEAKACALINPRPNDEEFTKYSFPSKTLEYMNSGRPVWSTKLAGIPEEYFSYIFGIENSSIESLKLALETILKCSENELDEMGQKSFAFVREKKNAYSQAKILLEFIKSLKRD